VEAPSSDSVDRTAAWVLSNDPVLADIATVDGGFIAHSFPVAPSLLTRDVLSVALALAGVTPSPEYGLFQRLVDPKAPSVMARFAPAPCITSPVDVCMPMASRLAMSMLQLTLRSATQYVPLCPAPLLFLFFLLLSWF
jgi:hypothetical protein